MGTVWATTEDAYSHFGLSRPAFGPVTEPGQIFRSRLVEPVAREILAGSPVLAIKGGRGVGKTLFMHVLAAELAARQVDAVMVGGISATQEEIQSLIARAGGIDNGIADPEKLLRALWNDGMKRLVLLCDNAETLPAATFRYLALLLKLRFSQPVRIQIVLLGAAGPWAGLGHPDLEALRQATETYVTLSLQTGEAAAYLDHRLSHAGQSLRQVMTQSAAMVLREEAHGNPRLLDELAAQALVYGSRTGRRRLTARSVRQAVMERAGSDLSRHRGRRVAIGAAAAFCAAGISAAAWLNRGVPTNAATALVVKLPPVALAPVVVAKSISVVPRSHASVAQAVSPRAASARVPAPAPHVDGHGPGLVLVAGAHDDMRALYRRVYRGLTPPPYSVVLAANPMPVRPGALIIFPAPPNGWAEERTGWNEAIPPR